jgi:hypothetical protein
MESIIDFIGWIVMIGLILMPLWDHLWKQGARERRRGRGIERRRAREARTLPAPEPPPAADRPLQDLVDDFREALRREREAQFADWDEEFRRAKPRP